MRSRPPRGRGILNPWTKRGRRVVVFCRCPPGVVCNYSSGRDVSGVGLVSGARAAAGVGPTCDWVGPIQCWKEALLEEKVHCESLNV